MNVSFVRTVVESDKSRNLETARTALSRAQSDHADLVIFPETFMASVVNQSNSSLSAIAESLEGPFVEAMQELAKAVGTWAVFGILERPPEPDSLERVYNTVVTVDGNGNIVNIYRKTHLYDAFGMRESHIFLKGEELPQAIEAPFGRFAVEVCYELRFPEISRRVALEDIHLLVVPAAWYAGPSKAEHWELLLRARALENTIFVAGVNQDGMAFAGESQVVDPLGVVVAKTSAQQQFISCELDVDFIRDVRKRLPCIEQTRPELFHHP